MRYPAKLEKIDGDYIATISHPNGRFQGACEGKTKKEALSQLLLLVEAMIISAIEDGDDLPLPEECERGNDWIILPPMLAAKAALYREMRESGVRKAEMARRLNVGQKQVDRILDPRHRSTLLQLEAAAESLGKHLEIRLT